MNYTVIWMPAPERRLIEIWTDASDRNAVTSAVSTIDGLLAKRPFSVGESRNESERILFERPLVVDYEVFEDDRQVRVVAVRLVSPV